MNMPKLKKSLMFKLIALLVVFSMAANYAIRKTRSDRKINVHEKIINRENIVELMLQPTDLIFSTDCECKNETKIVLRKETDSYTVNSVNEDHLEKIYTLTQEELDRAEFTCNHYSSFRRGKNQKIIGYALYGTGESEPFACFSFFFFYYT